MERKKTDTGNVEQNLMRQKSIKKKKDQRDSAVTQKTGKKIILVYKKKGKRKRKMEKRA